MATLDKLRTMTSQQIKEHDRGLVLYLLKSYPRCTDETSEDHHDFIDDMTDLLLSRTKITHT